MKFTEKQGTADVKAIYRGKKLEVNVSTYGMVILLAFNDVPVGESLTFEVYSSFISIQLNADDGVGITNHNINTRE